jgi:two-component system sensor histidine kinase AtoS
MNCSCFCPVIQKDRFTVLQHKPAMKKKILIIISIFSLLAVAGGAGLIYSIGHSSSNLQELIMLHQVEIQREHLLLNIHQVQEDLYSQTTTHPESIDAIKNHASRMEAAIKGCFACHHTQSVTERLSDLQHQIYQLNEALVLSTRDGHARGDLEKAHVLGDSLISKVNTMIVLTNQKLIERTDRSLQAVNQSKIIVLLLVVAGPLMIAVFGFMTLTSFARPIQTLLAATKRLKTGDLDFRIAGLKHEFAELAIAFNDMAIALRERLREITENERRYRLLFESAADAIFILDAEGSGAGKIVSANQAAATMHGYTVEELTQMNIRDIDTPDVAQRVSERIERILLGEWIKAESSHLKKDGTVFPIEISAGMFEFDNHRYILAIDRDMTERKRTEETLQRAEHLRTTGELAAGLAHEIKNPLAGIMVTMETLAEEPYITQEDRSVLFKVIDEIQRIDGLIKGLLNFARPPKPQFMPTKVNDILDAAAQMVLQNRHQTEESAGAPRSIELVKDLARDLPEIIADPMQLRQVFMNLLMNAVDAMPSGGTVHLKTSFDEALCAIMVIISDTGKGMDAAVLSKIFQPFFTTKAGGTGLGLAISKRLIEEQGGRISIESSAERGTAFSLTLACNRGKEAARDEG